jgi:hypothetical protein
LLVRHLAAVVPGTLAELGGMLNRPRKIEINDDAPGGEFEIEGSVGGLHGTCPTVSFKVNGYQVHTNAATTLEPAICTALKSG